MAIDLNNITKKVGRNVHIKSTSLVLQAGHFNVLLGATGAGKTSLIKLIAGLDKCSSGSVKINDVDITKEGPQKRNISLVHQFFVNYPNMTVYDNIASPLKVAKVDKKGIKQRVHEAADLLKLQPMLNRYPHELSGGQQQRIALARAIVKDSKVVLLDEPLANLDYKLREELREQLPQIFAGRGAVVVYATSEPEEALLLGGQTALMHDGQVVQFGDTAEIFRNPNHFLSAEVFSDPPINKVIINKFGLHARLPNTDIQWQLTGKAAALTDGEYTLAVRPHHITPINKAGSFVPLLGEILIMELSGSQSSAHFRCGEQDWISQAAGVHPYQIGAGHQFYMDPKHCFFFSHDGKRVA